MLGGGKQVRICRKGIAGVSAAGSGWELRMKDILLEHWAKVVSSPWDPTPSCGVGGRETGEQGNDSISG